MGSANGGEWQLAVVDWMQPFQNYWDPGSLERREKEMGGWLSRVVASGNSFCTAHAVSLLGSQAHD